MDDDDWLEDDNNVAGPSRLQGGSRDPLVDTEWNRISQKYSDAGYREGITDGKLSTLQHGFDQGFNLSVLPSRRLGNLRGRANGLLSLLTTRAGPKGGNGLDDQSLNKAIEALRELIRELGRVRRDDVLPIDKEREQHEKEEHAGNGDENGFEPEQTDQRDMESLEIAMEGIEATNAPSCVSKGNQALNTGQSMALREQQMLDALEVRLQELESAVR